LSVFARASREPTAATGSVGVYRRFGAGVSAGCLLKPIIIAGAGPAGCVAALYLARQGFDVVLLETLAALPATPRASTFHAPTLDMLAELDLAQPLIAQGLIARYYQYRDRRTGDIAEFDFAGLADDTAHPYRLQVEQWRLTQLIWERLTKQYPNADCRFGHTVRGVHQTSDGVQVLVSTHDGELLLDGAFLIGADGADSLVRRAVGIPFDGFTYPERFVVASTPFPLEEKFDRLVYVNYIADPEEWLVLLRAPTVWRILIPADSSIGDDVLMSSHDWLQQRLHHMAPHGRDYDIEHRNVYRVHQRVARHYRRDRTFLVGDAAHINNPIGGMGMNGGLHDAVSLAEKITSFAQGRGGHDLLDLYERQRRGVCVRFIQEHTQGNKRFLEENDPRAQARQQALRMQTAADPDLAHAHLLKTSMIQSLRDAAAIP
jgi:3-(3-hydroxy-phenyl)propionate hydroxylase